MASGWGGTTNYINEAIQKHKEKEAQDALAAQREGERRAAEEEQRRLLEQRLQREAAERAAREAEQLRLEQQENAKLALEAAVRADAERRDQEAREEQERRERQKREEREKLKAEQERRAQVERGLNQSTSDILRRTQQQQKPVVSTADILREPESGPKQTPPQHAAMVGYGRGKTAPRETITPQEWWEDSAVKKARDGILNAYGYITEAEQERRRGLEAIEQGTFGTPPAETAMRNAGKWAWERVEGSVLQEEPEPTIGTMTLAQWAASEAPSAYLTTALSTAQGEELRQEILDTYRRAKAEGKDPVVEVAWLLNRQETLQWREANKWIRLTGALEGQTVTSRTGTEVPVPDWMLGVATAIDNAPSELGFWFAWAGRRAAIAPVSQILIDSRLPGSRVVAGIIEAKHPGLRFGELYGAAGEALEAGIDRSKYAPPELVYTPTDLVYMASILGEDPIAWDPNSPTFGAKLLNISDRWTAYLKEVASRPVPSLIQFGKDMSLNLAYYDRLRRMGGFEEPRSQEFPGVPGMAPINYTGVATEDEAGAGYALAQWSNMSGPDRVESIMKDFAFQDEDTAALQEQALRFWREGLKVTGEEREALHTLAGAVAAQAVHLANKAPAEVVYSYEDLGRSLSFEFVFDLGQIADYGLGAIGVLKKAAEWAGLYKVADAIPSIRPAETIQDQVRRGVGEVGPAIRVASPAEAIRIIAAGDSAMGEGPWSRKMATEAEQVMAGALMFVEDYAIGGGKTKQGKAQTTVRYVTQGIKDVGAEFATKNDMRVFINALIDDAEGAVTKGIDIRKFVDPRIIAQKTGANTYLPGWGELMSPRFQREWKAVIANDPAGFKAAVANLPSLKGKPDGLIDKRAFSLELEKLIYRMAGDARGIDATGGAPFGSASAVLVEGTTPGTRTVRYLSEDGTVLKEITGLTPAEAEGTLNAAKFKVDIAKTWRGNKVRDAGSLAQSILSANALTAPYGIAANIVSVLGYYTLHTNRPLLAKAIATRGAKAHDFIRSRTGGMIGDLRMSANAAGEPGLTTGSRSFWKKNPADILPFTSKLREIRQGTEEVAYDMVNESAFRIAWNDNTTRVERTTIKPMVNQFFSNKDEARAIGRVLTETIRNGDGRRGVARLIEENRSGAQRATLPIIMPGISHHLADDELDEVNRVLATVRTGNIEQAQQELEGVFGSIVTSNIELMDGGDLPRRHFWTVEAETQEVATLQDVVYSAKQAGFVDPKTIDNLATQAKEWSSGNLKYQQELRDLLIVTNGNPEKTPLVFDAFLASDNISTEFRVRQNELRLQTDQAIEEANALFDMGQIDKAGLVARTNSAWAEYYDDMADLAGRSTKARTQVIKRLNAQLQGKAYIPRRAKSPAITAGNFARKMQEAFSLSEEQATSLFQIAAARAERWGVQTGRNPDEWFNAHISSIVPGGVPTRPDTLYQIEAPDTPAFRSWFRKSKVVDESGKPKVLYHGTGRHETTKILRGKQDNYTQFDQFVPSENGLYGPGVYMSDSHLPTGGWYEPDLLGPGRPGINQGYTGFDTLSLEDPDKIADFVEFFENPLPPGREHLAPEATNVTEWVWDFLSPNHFYHSRPVRNLATDIGFVFDDTKSVADNFRRFVAQAERAIGAKDIGRDELVSALYDIASGIRKRLQDTPYAKAGDVGLVSDVSAAGHVYPVFSSLQKPFDIDAPMSRQDINAILSTLPNWVDWGWGPKSYDQAVAILKNTPNLTGGEVYEVLGQFIRGGSYSHSSVLDPSKPLINTILQLSGFDGITHIGGGIMGKVKHQTYIAFHNTQVKSAIANRGSFMSADPRIQYQMGAPGMYKGAAEFQDDGRAILRGFASGDVSTAVHEMGHVYRRDLSSVAAAGDKAAMADIATLEKWAGVEGGQWNTQAEEKFARGFEAYLMTGKAPTAKLQGAFDRFKEWLSSIYKTVRTLLQGNKDALPDNVREVFDNLFSNPPVKGRRPTGETAWMPGEKAIWSDGTSPGRSVTIEGSPGVINGVRHWTIEGGSKIPETELFRIEPRPRTSPPDAGLTPDRVRRTEGAFQSVMPTASKPKKASGTILSRVIEGMEAETKLPQFSQVDFASDSEVMFERKIQLQDQVSKGYQAQAFIALQQNPSPRAVDEYFSAMSWTGSNYRKQYAEAAEAAKRYGKAKEQFGEKSAEAIAAVKELRRIKQQWKDVYQENWERWSAASALIMEESMGRQLFKDMTWTPDGTNIPYTLTFVGPGKKPKYVVMNNATGARHAYDSAESIPPSVLQAYQNGQANRTRNLAERLAQIAKQAGIERVGVPELDGAIEALANEPGGDALKMLRAAIMEQHGRPGAAGQLPTDAVEYTVHQLQGALARLSDVLPIVAKYNESSPQPWPDEFVRALNEVLLPQIDNIRSAATQAGHRTASRFAGDFTNEYHADLIATLFGSYTRWASRFQANSLMDLFRRPGVARLPALYERTAARENQKDNQPTRNLYGFPWIKFGVSEDGIAGGIRVDVGNYRLIGPEDGMAEWEWGLGNHVQRLMISPTTLIGRGWADPERFNQSMEMMFDPETRNWFSMGAGGLMALTQASERLGTGEAWWLPSVYDAITGRPVSFRGNELGSWMRLIGEAAVMGEQYMLKNDFDAPAQALGFIASMFIPQYYDTVVGQTIASNAYTGEYGEDIDAANITAQWAQDVAYQNRWNVDALPEQPDYAVPTYNEARAQTAQRRFWRSLISMTLGPTTEVRPGEREFAQAREQRDALGFAPEWGEEGTPLGGKELRNSVYDTVPGLGAASSVYAIDAQDAQGRQDQEVMRPGLGAVQGEYYPQSSAISAARDKAVEDAYGRYLAGEVDFQAAGEQASIAYDTAKEERDALNERYPSMSLVERDGPSTRGMNPTEALALLEERIMYDAKAMIKTEGVLTGSELAEQELGMEYSDAQAAGLLDQWFAIKNPADVEYNKAYDAKVQELRNDMDYVQRVAPDVWLMQTGGNMVNTGTGEQRPAPQPYGDVPPNYPVSSETQRPPAKPAARPSAPSSGAPYEIGLPLGIVPEPAKRGAAEIAYSMTPEEMAEEGRNLGRGPVQREAREQREGEVAAKRAEFEKWSEHWDAYRAIDADDWEAKRQYMLDNPEFAKYWKERYGTAWWEEWTERTPREWVNYGGGGYGGGGGGRGRLAAPGSPPYSYMNRYDQVRITPYERRISGDEWRRFLEEPPPLTKWRR